MLFRRLAAGAVLLLTLSVGAGTAGAAHDRYGASQPVSLTPANQPALDAAADDARAIAGDAYYSNAVVDSQANTVTLYLAHAPQAVIDRLTAAHPGTYVIDNTAVFSEAKVLELEDTIGGRIPAWAAAHVRIGFLRPTLDGHLEVGVRSDVAAAASRLGAQYGNAVRVVADTEPTHLTAWRYNDSSPWNGGDFIYHFGSASSWSDCSSGVPVHDATNGTKYMLTASHCFWDFGGVGTSVRNGYIRVDTNAPYSGSSTTLIGSVTKNSNLTSGSTTLDTALIKTATSTFDFVAAWNSQGYGINVGRATNHVGDQVCQSGAFDGQICGGIVIRALNLTECPGDFCVNHLVEAYNSTAGKVAVGEGDSGGPVYSYTGSNLLARGMTDQGSTIVSCTSVPPGTSGRLCFHVLYFVDMAAIDSSWNVTPNT
jgi:Trypsin